MILGKVELRSCLFLLFSNTFHYSQETGLIYGKRKEPKNDENWLASLTRCVEMVLCCFCITWTADFCHLWLAWYVLYCFLTFAITELEAQNKLQMMGNATRGPPQSSSNSIKTCCTKIYTSQHTSPSLKVFVSPLFLFLFLVSFWSFEFVWTYVNC